MGRVQRKLNGQWVDIEEFNRTDKPEQRALASVDLPPPAPAQAATQAEPKEQTVVEHAREVLARGNHIEIGKFLAEYHPDPTPKGKDDRVMALADFISDFE